MAALLMLMLVFFMGSPFLAVAVSRGSTITLGSSISTNITNSSFWPSPSGRFAFGFYPEGNGFRLGIWLIATPEITVVWTAFRDKLWVSDAATMLLTKDAFLLQTKGKNITISFPVVVSSASMRDSGNFVLYNGSKIARETFYSPTDTILGGQKLLTGDQLHSSVGKNDHSTGRFRLYMQPDGNLVLYPTNSTDTAVDAYWASGTNNHFEDVTLNLDKDGRLYLQNSTGFNMMNLVQGRLYSNRTHIYRATLDVDGIFRLYSHSFERDGRSNISVVWFLNIDACEVKGSCGNNSYCALVKREPTCICLPGFAFVDADRNYQGCKSNHTDYGCGSNNKENLTYSMSLFENTIWSDTAYRVLPNLTEEGCKQDCLNDCNCMVATLKDGSCSKYHQPVKYGRRDVTDSTKAFVKEGSQNRSGSQENSPREPYIPNPKKAKKPYRVLFLVSTILASFLLALLAFSGIQILVSGSRIRWYSDFVGYKVQNDQVNLRSFTYKELYEATNGFDEELGRGAFGSVFGGTLFGIVKIAVKKLDQVAEEGEKQFRTEMITIGKTHHRNLIRLLGYCDEGAHRLLVYEFMSNGSLAELLFGAERRPEWEERVRISMEIAMGLFYLHEECDTQIIHCDIKPQNILLGESWTAKIADFGLAKLLGADQTRTLTDARGTRGYVAPEWARHVPINARVDVYSFGVMLLEIICCRKSLVIDAPENEVILSDWVYQCFAEGKFSRLIAPEELESAIEKKRLERMVMIGLWCIQEHPHLRPTMKTVVLMLEGMVDVQVPPHPIPPVLAWNHNTDSQT